MSGAFRFWQRVLHHDGMNMFNAKSASTLAAATGWVVWKRIEGESDSKKPIPCEQEFKDLERFYSRVKSPENLNHFNRKTYMRVERNLRTCAAANPGYFTIVEGGDSSVQTEATPASKERGVAPQQPEVVQLSAEELEERMQRLEKNTLMYGGKDVVLFLPKEEQETKSVARIPSSEVEESRSPLLPNGEINWRCTCIERDMIGPCGLEFQEFRRIVHSSKRPDDDMTDEEIMAARNVIGNYIDCCKEHPLYYRKLFEDDDDDEDDEEMYAEADETYKKQQKEKELKDKGNKSVKQ